MPSPQDISPSSATEITDLDVVNLSQKIVAQHRMRQPAQDQPPRGILFANRAQSIHLVHLPVTRPARSNPTIYSIDTDFYVQDSYRCLFQENANANSLQYLTTAGGYQYFISLCPMQCPDLDDEYSNVKNDLVSAKLPDSSHNIRRAFWFGNVLVLKTEYMGVLDAQPGDIDIIAESVYTRMYVRLV
ncbi:hypothetical protein BDZ89DRAFT_1152100 [Hymenopellis radicata]|nr:hypothetical protein BDZ89DRAFT_1152100 [Hymenopellis radicata]